MTALLLLVAAALLAWRPALLRRRSATPATAATPGTAATAATPGTAGIAETDRLVQRRGRLVSLRRLHVLTVVSVACLGSVVFGVLAGAVAAAVLAPLAVAAVTRLDARRGRSAPDPALPFTLDLAAAALRAGQPVASALALAAPAAAPPVAALLNQVAALLHLGADPAEAWAGAAEDPTLAGVALAARRSANSGARLALGWEQLADDLRAELSATALARAQRAGVWAMAPLGLCFLPAFVCLGVVPTVIGIAHSLLLTQR
jgi:Flp pilus assembly protein TadB